jgi:uncharacterized protein HemX
MNANTHNWLRKGITAAVVLGAVPFLGLGCNSKDEEPKMRTMETENAQKQVNAYESNNSEAQKAQVEQAFAELDKEIRELEVRVENTTGEARAEAQFKLDELRMRKTELRVDYTEAKFKALLEDIKNSVR